MVNFGDLQLGARLGSNGECEEFVFQRGTLDSNRSKCGRMTFNELRYPAVFGEQLHRSNDTSLLLADTNHDHPLLVIVDTVVDDLASLSSNNMSVMTN